MLSVKLIPIVRALSAKFGEHAWDDGHAEEEAEHPYGFDVFAYQKAIASRVEADVGESVESAYMVGYHDGVESQNLAGDERHPLDVPRETAHQKRVHSLHLIDAILAVLLIAALAAIATGPVEMLRIMVILVLAVTAGRLLFGVYGLR